MKQKRPPKPKPFDIDHTLEQRKQLAHDFCRAIEDALAVRARVIDKGGLLDLVDWYYEQEQSGPADLPFPGAADLSSWFITENVDAMRARLMQAVQHAEPFCAVDGWGSDNSKAAFVEAFHEWQVEEEGLRDELGKVAHGALLEDCFVLEVRERIETRRIVETIDVAYEPNEQGAPILGHDGQPILRFDDAGEPVPPEPGQGSVKVERTYTKTKRLGPTYDAISMRDFVFLPGHARNMRQVWGYAYRIYERVPQLEELVVDGVYDAEAVKAVGTQSDREDGAVPPVVDSVAPQSGPEVEKELWQMAVFQDLDGDGREEWYVATVSLRHRELLRCKLDLFVQRVGKPRCVPFVLFPRRNSVYGYIYSGNKLLTLAEEHAGLRNMRADRSALVTNAPIIQVANGLWDSRAEPFGVGRTITVRDQNELRLMQIPDVPASNIQQEAMLIQAKERVGGLSDVGAIGSGDRSSQTLGQDQLVAQASAIRVEEPLAYFNAALKTVMQLRHAIWIDVLESEAKGLEAPATVVSTLAVQGHELQGSRFTLEQLKGRYRFKPAGTVESADNKARMMYFNQGLLALANLAKVFPHIQVMFQDPELAKAVVQEWARVYKFRNIAPFLKVLTAQPPMLPGAGGTAPGAMAPGHEMPSGGPPMGGPGGPMGGGGLDALIASLTGGPQGGGFSVN